MPKIVFGILFAVLVVLVSVLMLQRVGLFVGTFLLLIGAYILVSSWRNRIWQEMSAQYPSYVRLQLAIVGLLFVPPFIGVALAYARASQNVWIGFVATITTIFIGLVIYRNKTHNFGLGSGNS